MGWVARKKMAATKAKPSVDRKGFYKPKKKPKAVPFESIAKDLESLAKATRLLAKMPEPKRVAAS